MVRALCNHHGMNQSNTWQSNVIGYTVFTVLPNIYKFPLMGLPENESYLGHGDYHTSNFSKKNWIRNFLSEKTKKKSKVFDQICVKVTDDINISLEQT